MTLQSESGKTVGFYIPSHKRADKIHEKKLIPNATYVVRESERQDYEAEGVSVIGVPDGEINTLGKVRQWIIDKCKEDVCVQIDDDVSSICYCLKSHHKPIEEQDVVICEIMRIAQILIDLKIGFSSFTMTPDVRKRNNEFLFKGVTGGICIFNKGGLKGTYEQELLKVDTDFCLQELLKNRIVIIPDYIGMKLKYDKNVGGNNTGKSQRKLVEANNYLKLKWGCHYEFKYSSNQSFIKVKR